MNSFMTPLFSTSPSNHSHGAANQSSQVFSLRPSRRDSNLTIVRPAGYPADAPPLFSVRTSKTSKPNVVLYRGVAGPASSIGNARFHALSSTTDLSLRGQKIDMKMIQMSGNFSLECPRMGKLKWKLDQLTGSALELCGDSGRRLAQLKSAGFPGAAKKKLEIFVPCDDFFLDLVVLSAVVAKALTKAMTEAVFEVMQAAAGV